MASAPLNSTALIECDFCSFQAEEAWYLSHGAFAFLVVFDDARSQNFDIKAGQVAACPTCYPLVKAGRLKDLVTHYFERHSDCHGRQREVLKAYVYAYHGGVIRNLLNKEEYVTWRSPKPMPERFSVYTCPECGADITFDTTTYDRHIDLICPKCGVKSSIIGKGEVTAANLS